MPDVGATNPLFAHAAFVRKPYWGATRPPNHQSVWGAASWHDRFVTACDVCPNTFVRVFFRKKPTPGNQVFHVGCLVLVFSCFTVSHYVIYLMVRFPFKEFCWWRRLVLARPAVHLLLRHVKHVMDVPVCRQLPFISLFADLFDHLKWSSQSRVRLWPP